MSESKIKYYSYIEDSLKVYRNNYFSFWSFDCMKNKLTLPDPDDTSRERMINRHIRNKKRVASILTKIKRNSRSYDSSHMNDLQNLQRALSNNFFFQLLKTSKVSEDSDEDLQSNT